MANFLMRKSAAACRGNTDETLVNGAGAVTVGRGPISDIAAADEVVVVTNYGDDTVALLDPRTFAVDGVIAVPGEPTAVAVNGDRAYVSTSSAESDAVSVIDTTARAVIAHYPLAFSVTALAISPDGKRVFAGRTGDGAADVAVIDTTAERIGTIDIANGAGMSVDALRVDGLGERLYVATTDSRGSALVIVDLESAAVEGAVQIGAPIRDIALSDGAVYVLTSDRITGGAVQAVDVTVGAVADTVELGIGAPTQIAMSGNDTRAYVVDYDRISVLCTVTLDIVDTMSVHTRPSCVAVDSEVGRVHVADFEGNVTTFAVTPVPPIRYPDLVATDPIRVRELQPVGA